jgi:hypothetical protein
MHDRLSQPMSTGGIAGASAPDRTSPAPDRVAGYLDEVIGYLVNIRNNLSEVSSSMADIGFYVQSVEGAKGPSVEPTPPDNKRQNITQLLKQIEARSYEVLNQAQQLG